jgi:hypothetical protein
MYHWKGITFEDIEENDWGGYWSGVCDQCIKEYKIPSKYLDDAGSGCCMVNGCPNEADHYIDFPSNPISDEAIELWEEFGDVPMNPNTEEIEVEWRGFPAGTHREEIWHWFEEHFNISIADLMYHVVEEENESIHGKLLEIRLSIELEDDDTPFGGTSHSKETLEEFLLECNIPLSKALTDTAYVNKQLCQCGIKPIDFASYDYPHQT